MGHYDDDEYYGEWYHEEFLGEDPDDYNDDIEECFEIDATPKITGRDWIYPQMGKRDKWVYIIKVGGSNVKIGSCDPTVKHLKARLCEAKRWVPDAYLLAVKFFSSVKEERYLHKALGAEKEVIALNNRDKEFRASFIYALSRFTLFKTKADCLNNTAVEILPDVKGLSEILSNSAYCQDDNDFYAKLKVLFDHNERLSKISSKMKKMGWCGNDLDEYGDQDGWYDNKHDNLIETVVKEITYFEEAIEEGCINLDKLKN